MPKTKAPEMKRGVEVRKSKYVGVSWRISKAKYGASGKWTVQIAHDGVHKHLGAFPLDKEKQAAERYDVEARKLHGSKAKLNFPRAGEAQAGVGKKSKYVGVSWSACDSKWLVHTSHKGVKRAVGRFPPDQEKEAAECYDKEARKEKNRPVNFPRAGEEQAIKRGSVLPQNEREAADS